MEDFILLLPENTFPICKNELIASFKRFVNYLKKGNNHDRCTYSHPQPLPAYVLTTSKPASHESTITTH